MNKYQRLEVAKRWLERVKVLRYLFVALIGVKLYPLVSGESVLIALCPIYIYYLLEEARITLESSIRNMERKISEMERKRKEENTRSKDKEKLLSTFKRSQRRRNAE
jgi:hypothetical protein